MPADDPNPKLDVREVYRQTVLVEIVWSQPHGERPKEFTGALSDFLVAMDGAPVVFDIAAGAIERLTPDAG